MKLKSKAKTSIYPDIDVGNEVRLQLVHKTPKGFKEQWSTELHTFQKDYHNGVYNVDGDVYPRKELQLVKGDVVKLPENSKQEQAIIKKKDKIGGEAANHLAVKQLLNTKQVDEKLVKHLQETRRSKRATSASSNYATFAGKTQEMNGLFY